MHRFIDNAQKRRQECSCGELLATYEAGNLEYAKGLHAAHLRTVEYKPSAGRDVPTQLAEKLFDLRMAHWKILWDINEAANLLEQACAGNEALFRELSHEVCHTSHRNTHRWAERARQVPSEQRDPLYGNGTHHSWFKRGWLK